MSEQFQLDSNRLYIGMTKSKSSASYVVVPPFFAIRLMYGAKLSNDTWNTGAARTVILPLTKLKALLKSIKF